MADMEGKGRSLAIGWAEYPRLGPVPPAWRVWVGGRLWA